MTPYLWHDAPQADFAVIGDPVAHSRSPQMHMAAFKALGLDYRYVAIQVPPGDVGAALTQLREMGYKGINVTVPHKGEAIAWCAHVDRFVSEVEAVNTIDLERKAGINTDANGFLETILNVEGKTALMLGAGGSARALSRALVREGWDVRIHNRTPEKAVALAGAVGAIAVEKADPAGASLILNTTSASLDGEQLPILWDRAEKTAVAYDLAYGQDSTPFLRKAHELGLTTMDGLPMLVEQGALSLEWWIGVDAPRDVMTAAIANGIIQ
jgi:shikimate dehydrogenase